MKSDARSDYSDPHHQYQTSVRSSGADGEPRIEPPDASHPGISASLRVGRFVLLHRPAALGLFGLGSLLAVVLICTVLIFATLLGNLQL